MSMVKKKVSNERSLYWCLVLYPGEDPKHRIALDYIQFNYSYAFIKHDKDTTDTGELKKEHYHVIIRFNNYRWRNAVAEELGITPNYLEKCRNLEKSLKYLIHFDNENKYQYDINCVQGDLKEKLLKYIEDKTITESEKVLILIDYIKSSTKQITITDLIIFCCHKNLYDIYRRNAYSFNKIIEEHNYQIFKKDQYKY